MDIAYILKMISEHAESDKEYAALGEEFDKVVQKFDKARELELKLHEQMPLVPKQDRQAILYDTFPKIFNLSLLDYEAMTEAYNLYVKAINLAKQKGDTELFERVEQLMIKAINSFNKSYEDSALLNKKILSYLK